MHTAAHPTFSFLQASSLPDVQAPGLARCVHPLGANHCALPAARYPLRATHCVLPAARYPLRSARCALPCCLVGASLLPAAR